ncbi:hypothetical protein ACFWN1_05700 [Streptomyces sp. NPDC058459]|uniref:hypothetical protein n=1 Tax=Streptomyces sp. NPDC058459 TaxID=3346508 RepID=UPI00364B5662
MTARPRCTAGHFLPAGVRPGAAYEHARPAGARYWPDMWGQGLARRHTTRIRTVHLTGSYL